MKYTKRPVKNKKVVARRNATWEKFKQQQNALAAAKRSGRQSANKFSR